jgi:hypothetical protein
MITLSPEINNDKKPLSTGGWGVNLRGPEIRQKMKKMLAGAAKDQVSFSYKELHH